MDQYNSDWSPDPDHLLRDHRNAILLRSDIHTTFDRRGFVFFPKLEDTLAVHMLQATPDYGPAYHNGKVEAGGCAKEFLFARFAWALFPLLSGFLSRPNVSRLVVHIPHGSGNTTTQYVTEEITSPQFLRSKVVASQTE